MRTVSAREANQQFSKLLEAAVGGEEVTITRRGVPVAKLVPCRRGACRRTRRSGGAPRSNGCARARSRGRRRSGPATSSTSATIGA